MNRLADQVALITGAGAGIGKESAKLFASEGARVAILELNPQSGAATAESVRALGGEAIFVQADITREAEVKAAVGAVAAEYGRIDVLVNCAGGSLPADAPVTEVDMSVWDHTMNLDVLGTILPCRHVIPLMIQNGHGSIVNMATWGALRGANSKHIYTAAKGAIVSLTRALAGDYARYGIRANAIAPGVVRTERSIRNHESTEARNRIDRPSKEVRAYLAATYPFSVGEPIDIANIALFLASGESRMVTGAVILADGGRSAY